MTFNETCDKLLKFIDEVEKEHSYKVLGDTETYSPYNEAWCDALDRVRGFVEAMGKEGENNA